MMVLARIVIEMDHIFAMHCLFRFKEDEPFVGYYKLVFDNKERLIHDDFYVGKEWQRRWLSHTGVLFDEKRLVPFQFISRFVMDPQAYESNGVT